MVCVPTPSRTPIQGPADAFGFASGDAYARTVQNAAVMWAAPWQAYWTLVGEAMNPANHVPAVIRRG